MRCIVHSPTWGVFGISSKFISKVREEVIVGSVFDFFDNKIPQFGLQNRDGQIDMALDIAEAIANKKNIMVEAGVGIGKSYGYLLPSIFAHKYYERPVIIATSSNHLSEQLSRDIQKVSMMTGIKLNVAIGKGMAHYVCTDRLLFQTENQMDSELREKYTYILQQGYQERNNEAQLNDDEWDLVNVKECRFEKCDYKSECKFYNMRNSIGDYGKADIILINIDLLMAHLKKISYEYYGGILNRKSVLIVIDEAHNLEDKARNAYTISWTLKEMYQKLTSIDNILSRTTFTDYYQELNYIKELLGYIYSELRNQALDEIAKDARKERARFHCNPLVELDLQGFKDSVKHLSTLLQLIGDYRFEKQADKCIDFLNDLTDFVTEFNKEEEQRKHIFWSEFTSGKRRLENFKVSFAPKNIDQLLRELLFSKEIPVILTSATICNQGNSLKERYSYITKSIGYTGILSEPKSTPFDYDNNSILYLPMSMVAYDHENLSEYYAEVTKEILKLIKITHGRTLILFTAKSDLEHVFHLLKKSTTDYEFLKQQNGSTQKETIQKFKDSKGVLLGTGVFWEGVDIPGSDLSQVIIPRLPFPVPDPIINYKCSIAADKLNDVLVPQMLIKLRQGAGRLIRSETDTGVLSILDSRLSYNSKAPYKEDVLNSLPIKRVTGSLITLTKFANEKIIPRLVG
jgi:ATP-dependent DNA helicase DinG